jgi:hypothetical protein
MRIDELRSTLDQDTSTALRGSAHETATRLGAVHARVARIRRRRRASAVGVTVAAAVAAVATLVVPPFVHDAAPQPAGHAPAVLVGRKVPTTQTATGFGYHYVQGVQSRPGQKSLTLAVRVHGKPRLVMWASSGDTGTLRLASEQDQYGPEISRAGGFDRYAYLGAGDYTEHLRLTPSSGGAGRLALAVYDLDDHPARGMTDGTITYRRQVLDNRLIGAVIGNPGGNDVWMKFRLPSTDLRWSDTCYGANGWYEVTVNGQGLFGASCTRRPELDPGAYGGTFGGGNPFDGLKAGDLVRVRLRFVDRHHTDRLVSDPHVVLGMGVYTHRERTHRVAGVDLPVARESGGHEYLESESFETTSATRVLRVDFEPSDKPRLLTWVASGVAGDSRLRLSRVVGGRTEALDDFASSTTSHVMQASGFVLQPGQHPSIRVSVPLGFRPSTRIGLQVSDLVH